MSCVTDRIQNAEKEEQAHLNELRDTLLDMTHEIDEAIKEQEKLSSDLMDEILKQENIEEATLQALPGINEIFLEVLRKRIQAARSANDEDQLKKLQAITSAIQKVSAPGANVEFIEALIQAEDEAAINKLLEDNADEVTDDFMSFMLNLMNQTSQQQGREAAAEKLQQIYRQALRFTMKRNLESEPAAD